MEKPNKNEQKSAKTRVLSAKCSGFEVGSYADLPLFSILETPTAKTAPAHDAANSGYIGAEDLALAKETNANGYDLDRPARVYSISEHGKPVNLWKVSTRDAMRICSHPKSHGKMYGGEWFYCWTQHDVDGEQNKVKPAFSDDGRLAKFEGLEDVQILGVY